MVGSITNFSAQALQAYSGFESLETGLNNIMKNMGLGADAGEELFESLRKFSLQTTFGVDTLANASQQLLTVGESADTLQNKILQLGNIAGGSTEKFNRLVEVYTKIKAMGKATAIQLQQLSMITGVSFVSALGKTNASAEELDELFQRMTESGGQFAGAMDSLNNTMEGKLEFVTSTWKEFQATFAEVSGLADVSKNVLDGVWNILQNIVDLMNSWTDNPIMQALLTGVLVGAITAIATALISLLVPALTKTIAMVASLATTIGISFPLIGIISGIAGAVVGLTSAIKRYNAEQKEIELAKYEEQTQAFRDRAEVLKGLSDAEVQSQAQTLSEKDISSYTIDEELMDRAIKMYEAQTEMFKVYKQNSYLEDMGISFEDFVGDDTIGQFEKANAGWSELTKQMKEAEEEYNRVTKEVERLKKAQQELDLFNAKLVATQNLYNENLEAVKEWYKTTNEGMITVLQQRIEEAQKLYSGYTEKVEGGPSLSQIYRTVLPSAEEKTQIDAYIASLQAQLDELMDTTPKTDSIKTWRQFWKEVTGVSIEGLTGLAGATKTINELSADFEKQKGFNAIFDISELETYNAEVDKFKSMILDLGAEKGIDNPFTTEDESIKSLVAEYYRLKGIRDELQSQKDEEDRIEAEQNVLNLQIEQADRIKAVLATSNSINEAKLRLDGIEKGITDENMEQYLAKQRELNLLNAKMNGEQAYLALLKEEALVNKDIAEYTRLSVQEKINNKMQNTDIGQIKTLTTAGIDPAQAVLSVIATELVDIIGGMEGVDLVLNPIKEMLMGFEPLIKSIVLTTMPFAKALSGLTQGIMKLLDFITGGLFTRLSGMYDEMIESNKKDSEKDVISALLALKNALEKEEEYYNQRKSQLNADSKIATSVHDMILTPQGNFSTDPDDYIIASKNPSTLGKGSATVVTLQPIINNSMSDTANVTVSTTTDENGNARMLVQISKKVAYDYANGLNGWDNAQKASQNRMAGRKVNI